jgi:hypothetical protein
MPKYNYNPHREDPVEIYGEIQAETEKAYKFFDGTQAVWVPKSLCTWDDEESVMTMPQWMAEEKGLA